MRSARVDWHVLGARNCFWLLGLGCSSARPGLRKRPLAAVQELARALPCQRLTAYVMKTGWRRLFFGDGFGLVLRWI